MAIFHLSITAKVLVLFSLIDMTVGYLQCINNIPKPPQHGKLHGPYGGVIARLICPPGEDIPLNTRNHGILECNPMKNTFNLIDVPKHECLPIKEPDSLYMTIDLIYLNGACGNSDRSSLKTMIRSKLPNAKSMIKREDFRAKWLETSVTCGVNDVYPVDQQEYVYRFMVSVKLQLMPYDTNRNYSFYLNLLHDIKLYYFDRTNSDTAPQRIWSVPGFILRLVQYSPLYASCKNQPHTVGTNLEYSKIASCRGCARDYVLPKGSKNCVICSVHSYTLQPFSDHCIRCPQKANWKEGIELYEKYCHTFEADHN